MLRQFNGLLLYIVDVIGILKHKEPKREYLNDNQEDKTQVKFSITDGRYKDIIILLLIRKLIVLL